MANEPPRTRRKAAGREKRDWVCTICGRKVSFCWSCPCGFMICAECMHDNAWGLTCNNVTWECPDCGAVRAF